jgi:hypothetical protein
MGDLFGALDAKITDPIVGLRIKLQPCRCGCGTVRVVKGEWLMVPVACEGCGMERGRLSYATITFIYRAIELWGRPTSPIELKRENYIATSPQPSGAGAEMQSTAPTGLKGAQR